MSKKKVREERWLEKREELKKHGVDLPENPDEPRTALEMMNSLMGWEEDESERTQFAINRGHKMAISQCGVYIDALNQYIMGLEQRITKMERELDSVYTHLEFHREAIHRWLKKSGAYDGALH